jgi:prephenate dehydrogenase
MLPSPPFHNIAVLGVGLIGESVARAAERTWPAISICRIDRGDDLAPVRSADLVVLAAAVLTNVTLLPQLDALVRRDALVTDVGSTKRRMVSAAEPRPFSFIGGHPMAGAARGGAENARADLFAGRTWILTPSAAHRTDALARLETFVSGLGAVPHIMTPELHDRFVGAVSHLPQFSASALMHVVGKLAGDAGLELAGAGLRDSTRLAASPADIWRDVAGTNDDVLKSALDALIRTLSELRDSLPEGDAVDAVFTSARRWRDALDRGAGTGNLEPEA